MDKQNLLEAYRMPQCGSQRVSGFGFLAQSVFSTYCDLRRSCFRGLDDLLTSFEVEICLIMFDSFPDQNASNAILSYYYILFQISQSPRFRVGRRLNCVQKDQKSLMQAQRQRTDL